MNEIPANLLYSPNELERWLDDTSKPISDDELCDMWILSAQEHPEMFLPKEISSVEALSTWIAESSMYTNAKPCDIIGIDEQKKD